MTGTATGGLGGPAAAAADLPTLAAAIEPVTGAGRNRVDATPGTDAGRLTELAAWLTAVTGRPLTGAPRRPRCLCVGHVPDRLLTLADDLAVGVRELVPGPDALGRTLDGVVAAVDAEVDAGADLVVVTTGEGAPDVRDPAAALVAALRDLEPVAVLPRGAAATDTTAWIARAERVRAARRRLVDHRTRPAELLSRLADPTLTALAGVIARATARRTPVVLDGAPAYAAALVVERLHRGAASWWQLADSSAEPAAQFAARELELAPVLQLEVAAPGGVAGLLTVQALRAAAVIAAAPEATP